MKSKLKYKLTKLVMKLLMKLDPSFNCHYLEIRGHKIYRPIMNVRCIGVFAESVPEGFVQNELSQQIVKELLNLNYITFETIHVPDGSMYISKVKVEALVTVLPPIPVEQR